MSGLHEYMSAILNALRHVPVIRKAVEKCSCERHQTQQDDDDFGHCQDSGVKWEDLLGERVEKLIAASCCPAAPEEELRLDSAASPPRMTPWKCTHHDENKQQCTECGIEKLNIDKCP